jgi:glyoxylase-like metal-dependent hydrolase (beta-lactamase superfamily II)
MNGDRIANCRCGRKSFPPGGLVNQSRVGYQNELVETKASRPGIFVFADSGGGATAHEEADSRVDTDLGFGPCVDQIRQRIVSTLQEAPRFVIGIHWHFDHAKRNRVFAEQGGGRLLPPRMDHHLLRRRYSLGGAPLGVAGARRRGRGRRRSFSLGECASRGRSLRVQQTLRSIGLSL